MKIPRRLAVAATAITMSVTLAAPAYAATTNYFPRIDITHTPQGDRVHVYHHGGDTYPGMMASSNRLHERMWNEYKQKTPPHLHTNSMKNQLSCHIANIGAKDPWNLESWRPDVGYAATVRALCNP
ncbi:DUF2599 domain-containing protein [uncultured Corynebacterium sp.]|uniref:DUF2599 domain-containing protein n=2 Tax=Corynebacteriaceae TaxID=1653 RepID=UPI0011CBA259